MKSLLLKPLMGLSCLALLTGCSGEKAVTPEPSQDILAEQSYDPITMDLAVIDEKFPPVTIELSFTSFGERLNGHLYLANGEGPHPTIILLHGFPGNEKNIDIAQSARRAGFNVLFFHYRGAWGSDGDFSFSHVVEDVESAISFLKDTPADYRINKEKVILLGHSMGGFAALKGAMASQDIQCVAGLATANFGPMAMLLEAQPDQAAGFAAYVDAIGPLKGIDGKSALNELISNKSNFDINQHASKLTNKRVLLIAGSKDTVLPPALIHAPMVTAFQAEETIDLTHKLLDGDHGFSRSRIQLQHEIIDWLEGCR